MLSRRRAHLCFTFEIECRSPRGVMALIVQLSDLHLHGHKHYPAARALAATTINHGDLLIVGAGSAGTELPWTASDDPERARLWPSFNVIELGDDGAVLAENRARFRILPSTDRPFHRYDLHCERTVRDANPEAGKYYGEILELVRHARFEPVREGTQALRYPPDKRAVRSKRICELSEQRLFRTRSERFVCLVIDSQRDAYRCACGSLSKDGGH